MAVLNGLPFTYGSLVVAFDDLGNSDGCYNFYFVKFRLLQEEQ